jgi:pimeloyl-ACP methyl ester carboxylesterase
VSASLPLVLIPGLLDTHRLYAPQLDALWRLGPVHLARHTDHDSMAGLAQALLEAAPARFALAGLSMGGYIAFEVLRQAPARVARLALLDTQARPDTPESGAARRAQMQLAQREGLQPVVEALLPRLLHPARLQERGLRALLHEMAAEVGVAGYLNQQNANLTRPDSRPNLAQIRCPTLIVVGAQDALTPPECAQEMAAAIPGARLLQLPDCGHMCTLEQPAAVAEALVAWLRG